jgi:hypothetical protein
MAAMEQFDHILNWKLKEGSHPFPGKDGGTCINEAAIVAAGFEYRPVHSVDRMPECFSRPICKLAMQLNDYATDAERQRLLPYVTRLACADTPEVEAKRAALIKSQNVTARSFDRHLNATAHPFDHGLKVLECALAIGRQADTLGLDAVKTRMEEVQLRRSRLASQSPIWA